jgi:hypothetical protein
MLVYLTMKAVDWARENRVDCDDDPCDDCTEWIGVM